MRFLKCTFFLLLSLNLLIKVSGYSNPENSIPSNQIQAHIDKIYVQPNQIYFLEKQILILVNDNIFNVNSLGVDEQGIYAYSQEIKICPRCGSEFSGATCSTCSWPLWDYDEKVNP